MENGAGYPAVTVWCTGTPISVLRPFNDLIQREKARPRVSREKINEREDSGAAHCALT